MSAIERIKRLFRREPMTDEELRAQREAKVTADRYRGLKSSQLSEVGEYDASKRGGRGTY